MPSPFPGMNPYLEHPKIWSEVHKWLTVLIAETLNPQLRPKYRVAIEERVYQTSGEDTLLVGIPDNVVTYQTNSVQRDIAVAVPPTQPVTVTVPLPETVRERYLVVRQVETSEVVTVIEILSPKNKRPGEGRQKYQAKRQKILGSLTHLIEIDLLRRGDAMPTNSRIQTDYRILVSRSHSRPHAELYAFNIQDVIPSLLLPLRPEDSEPKLSLQNLLHRLYDLGSYDLAINYQLEPMPALSEEEAAWADKLLREEELR